MTAGLDGYERNPVSVMGREKAEAAVGWMTLFSSTIAIAAWWTGEASSTLRHETQQIECPLPPFAAVSYELSPEKPRSIQNA